MKMFWVFLSQILTQIIVSNKANKVEHIDSLAKVFEAIKQKESYPGEELELMDA